MHWICGFCVLMVCISISYGSNQVQEHSLIHRLIRSAGGKRNQQCRYEKLPWEECDLATGTQRRQLKLKTGQRQNQCETVKEITRPCKKVCRYAKGAWSECSNGERTRTDTLKNGPISVGCEPLRTINKKCKTACRYSKSEWSNCESGIKTKTLTLVEGDGPDCEATKAISKQCGQNQNLKQRPNSKHGRQRGRKHNGSSDDDE